MYAVCMEQRSLLVDLAPIAWRKKESECNESESNKKGGNLLDNTRLDLLRIDLHRVFGNIRSFFASLCVQHRIHGEAYLIDPLQVVVCQLEVQFEAHIVLFENRSVGGRIKAEATQHGRVARTL